MKAIVLTRCTRIESPLPERREGESAMAAVRRRRSLYDYAIEASTAGLGPTWDSEEIVPTDETGCDRPTAGLLVWGAEVAVVFVVEEVLRDHGDVTAWRLIAAPRHRRLVPASAGVTITVLNT